MTPKKKTTRSRVSEKMVYTFREIEEPLPQYESLVISLARALYVRCEGGMSMRKSIELCEQAVIETQKWIRKRGIR